MDQKKKFVEIMGGIDWLQSVKADVGKFIENKTKPGSKRSALRESLRALTS